MSVVVRNNELSVHVAISGDCVFSILTLWVSHNAISRILIFEQNGEQPALGMSTLHNRVCAECV